MRFSFADILRVFFTVHDPTQLNRQGNDVGESYRSAIFYHDDEQKKKSPKRSSPKSRAGFIFRENCD